MWALIHDQRLRLLIEEIDVAVGTRSVKERRGFVDDKPQPTLRIARIIEALPGMLTFLIHTNETRGETKVQQ